MTEIWTMGELLAEIMRADRDVPLGRVGSFAGPFASGAPGIFIDTAARLGHTAAIVSGVGDDEFGRMILQRLELDGVRTDLVDVVGDRSTGTAFIAYAADGSREYLFHWDGTAAVIADIPPLAAANGARYFHVMGCSLMANAEFAARIVQTAAMFKQAGATITLDPNVRSELLTGEVSADALEAMLEMTSILMPSEAELRSLAGVDGLDAGVAAVSQRYGFDMVVVKRGQDGVVVYANDKRAIVPAFMVDEVDPTGAGDCFDAAFLCGLLDGMSPRDAARMGAAAGALNAQAFGPMEGAISPSSVERLLALEGATRP
jgi:sugar/nucleoside kinase (ribokinase family)